MSASKTIDQIKTMLWCDISEGGRIKKVDTGCWEWQGAILGKQKYGCITYHRKKWLAHRLSWFLFHGNISDDMKICHDCDNPICVRPDHLFEGTQGDNVRDMTIKGRHGRTGASGEKNGGAKLTADQIMEIRQKYKSGEIKQKDIIRIYNISSGQTSRIISGKKWKHLQ